VIIDGFDAMTDGVFGGHVVDGVVVTKRFRLPIDDADRRAARSPFAMVLDS
jgi:hypothetical protein